MSSAPSPRCPTPLLPGIFQGLDGDLSAEPVLFLPWVEQHVQRQSALSGKLKTMESKLGDAKLFYRFFCERFSRPPLLSELTDELADDFWHWHKQRREPKVTSNATPNRSARNLHSIRRDACQKRDAAGLWLTRAPSKPPRGKVDKPLITAWTMEDLGRLLDAAWKGKWKWYRPRGSRRRITGAWSPPAVSGSQWLYAVLITLYYTGLRITCCLRTPLSGLDLRAGVLRVPAHLQKNKREQMPFPLHPKVIEAWCRLDVHSRSLDCIGGDWPYDRNSAGQFSDNWKIFNRWFKRALFEAGLAQPGQDCRRLLSHKIRRTFASWLARTSSVEDARRWLGHSSLQQTLGSYVDPTFLENVDPSQVLPAPIMPPQEILIFGPLGREAAG